MAGDRDEPADRALAWDRLLRDMRREDAELARELRRRADRISSLIVAGDLPDVDVEIRIRRLRDWVAKHLPERRDLFEMVYASRFRRLREQFRGR